jgi:hypothetical protein
VLFCLVAVTAGSAASARLRCSPGAFVVHAGPRILPGATGGYDVLHVAADGRHVTVALGATCRRVRARTRGRRVTAVWPRGRCDVPGRVTLKMTLDDACEIASGRVKRSGSQLVPLVASRCAADGVVSAAAGEECAASDACSPDRRCVDCRCMPIVRFARDVQPIFAQCLTAACHEGPNAPGSFELVMDRAYPELLTRRARAGRCGGQPLVVPGDPDASVLWKRVGGAACGASMPLGSMPLPAQAVDAIRAWIAEGAPAD